MGFNNQQFVSELDEFENSPENSGGDSPRSAVSVDHTKLASTSSNSKRRRAIQKRVVSVPIRDVEGFKMKGDQMSTPPSDSWAWRKYGQKPIKGSPYPRGYYRCSSSKGCPARKQVERSRLDSTMLMVTYYSEHNHPWPASRTNHRTTTTTTSAAATTTPVSDEDEEEVDEEEEEEKKPIITNPSINIQSNNNQSADHQLINISDYRFTNLGEGHLVQATEFGWLTDFESQNCTILESPILSTEEKTVMDVEMAAMFTMREEDESFFADLDELPECSTVFRRGMAEQRRRTGLATTG